MSREAHVRIRGSRRVRFLPATRPFEINSHYPKARAIVVSDDVKDRMPRKESVLTACNRLAIECWPAHAFVHYIRTTLPFPT